MPSPPALPLPRDGARGAAAPTAYWSSTSMLSCSAVTVPSSAVTCRGGNATTEWASRGSREGMAADGGVVALLALARPPSLAASGRTVMGTTSSDVAALRVVAALPAVAVDGCAGGTFDRQSPRVTSADTSPLPPPPQRHTPWLQHQPRIAVWQVSQCQLDTSTTRRRLPSKGWRRQVRVGWARVFPKNLQTQ